MRLLKCAALAGLFPLSSAAQVTPPGIMYTELQSLAGAHAVVCGAVPLGSQRTEASACARAAVSSRKAFWVAFQRQGTDSFVWEGAAGDGTGRLFALFYDSDISGGLSGKSLFGVSQCVKLKFTRHRQPIVRCRELRGES
jgi:hypothetical protein